MRMSQKLVFHQSKCVCAIKRILSTTAMLVSSPSFMYLRIPCYCDACFKVTRLACGSEDVTQYNTRYIYIHIDNDCKQKIWEREGNWSWNALLFNKLSPFMWHTNVKICYLANGDTIENVFRNHAYNLFYSTFVCLAAPVSFPLELFEITFLKNNTGIRIRFNPTVERVESYTFTLLEEQYSIEISGIDSSTPMQVFVKCVKRTLIKSFFSRNKQF